MPRVRKGKLIKEVEKLEREVTRKLQTIALIEDNNEALRYASSVPMGLTGGVCLSGVPHSSPLALLPHNATLAPSLSSMRHVRFRRRCETLSHLVEVRSSVLADLSAQPAAASSQGTQPHPLGGVNTCPSSAKQKQAAGNAQEQCSGESLHSSAESGQQQQSGRQDNAAAQVLVSLIDVNTI